MKQESNHSIVELLCTVRERMLGEIIPSLRGIAVEWENNCIILYFYHDGQISDAIEEHYTGIGAEVVSDYANVGIKEEVISFPYPEILPKKQYWAYRRKEPFEDPSD